VSRCCGGHVISSFSFSRMHVHIIILFFQWGRKMDKNDDMTCIGKKMMIWHAMNNMMIRHTWKKINDDIPHLAYREVPIDLAQRMVPGQAHHGLSQEPSVVCDQDHHRVKIIDWRFLRIPRPFS